MERLLTQFGSALAGSMASCDSSGSPQPRGTDAAGGTEVGPIQHMSDGMLRSVFRDFDRDNSGYIEVDEVLMALQRLNLPATSSSVKGFITAVDRDADNKISFAEFASFVLLREEALLNIYKSFHVREHNEAINPRDLRLALRKMNVNLTLRETRKLLALIVSDEQREVSFNSFCSMLLLLPPEGATEAFIEWIDESVWDAGDGLQVPEDKATPAWQLLVAGGIAGAVSRTATAPMDRLKTLLQAQVPSHARSKRAAAAAAASAREQPPVTGRVQHPHKAHAANHGPVAGSTTASVANAGAANAAKKPVGTLPVSGIWQGMRAIYAEGGYAGFFRGNGTNVIKVAPETACKFFVYERMKKLIARDPNDITVMERFASGASAGAIGQMLIYPLEITKTRMALARTGEYTGIVDCLVKIGRHEGLRNMYRGMGASITGIIPYAGTDLTVYSLLRDAYATRYPDDVPGTATLLTCGALSSTTGQLVAYPLQLVRTRLQAQGMHKRPVVYHGIVDCVRKTVAEDGFLGLYRGLLPNFLKALPAISISYAVYEKSKTYVANL